MIKRRGISGQAVLLLASQEEFFFIELKAE
jgi:hypothetical protein